jgi:hypothetical protein
LLYVPFPGTYRLQASSKDEFLWGIGASPNGTVSFVWNGGIGQTLSSSGQTTTALNNYPLISKAITLDGGGQINTSDVLITFSAAGNYPFEIDFDYWFHSNRRLLVKQLIGGASYNIAPIPSGSTVIANAQYRYVYRSSATGAVSNPSPPSTPTTVSSVTNTLSALASTDPQVDKIDWYRIDSSITSYTYVGTGPNSNATFSDSTTDEQIVGNPQLEFDNFEPFPSIDLPASGTVNVGANGLVTWASGTQFKSGSRGWLPGTIVVIGTSAATPNQGTTWLLFTRPTSPTKMTVYNTSIINGVTTFTYPQAGTGFFYQIAEPILAAQPLPYMWGPTDNVAYAFACGDSLRPGTTASALSCRPSVAS